MKIEQEVDHGVDVEIQLEERGSIVTMDDGASTSEGSNASTLTADNRQEKYGNKELPKELSEMKIRDNSCEDNIKVTSYLYTTSCCFLFLENPFLWYSKMLLNYRIWSLLLLAVTEQKQAR